MLKKTKQYFSRFRLSHGIFVVLGITIACIVFFSLRGNVNAAEFIDRSLMVESPVAGATVQYEFTFGYKTALPVGSVRYLFCDTPLPLEACTPPVGLDVQSAVLSAQSGETGFSIVSQSQNEIIIGRPAQVPAPGMSTYMFNGVVNPTSESQVVFVRMSSYLSSDATGPVIDEGGVATMTTPDVEIYTQVPPILIFCVATIINDTDCTDMTGNYTDLGELSSTQTASVSTQMQARTNARSGYTIQMTGNSLTSGIHEIPALTTPTASFVGVGQFGMNMTTNTAPAIGSDPTGPGINAVMNANYTITNQYLYNDGDVLVTSLNPTRNRKFTLSHIVNVPEAQALGVYSTTITYVCIASF